MKKRLVLFLVSLLLVSAIFAHGNEGDEKDFENEIKGNGFFDDFLPAPFVIAIFILSAIPFLLFSFTRKKISRQLIIFWIVIYLVSSITLVIIADTISLTVNSETKGPVHWHADFQIWNCNKRVDIVDPEDIANRVGTRLVHEHGDDRIHVEGVIRKLEDADLHNFFNYINGKLNRDSFSIPVHDGFIERKDGELCNGEKGEVQIFAYVASNANARQKSGFLVEQLKVNENYIISPYQDVPPGDCIIIEFDKRKDKTEKICDTYQVAVEQGRMVIV